MPPLLPVTPEEKEAFDAAGLKKAQLQKADSDSTIRVPPNASESALVHKLFTSTLVNGANVLGSNAVWMHNATVHKAILMHSQQRNLYGKSRHERGVGNLRLLIRVLIEFSVWWLYYGSSV